MQYLEPIPFERQVKELLREVKTSEALDLVNATFGPLERTET